MSSITIWEGLGSAAGPSSSLFYVHCKVTYDPDAVKNNQAYVTKTYDVYGPSKSLSTNGKVSWLSTAQKIGGTGTTVSYNGKTYYVSATYSTSAWYDSGATISVSGTASYYGTSTGTTYKSTLTQTVTVPTLVTKYYTVRFMPNGGTGSMDDLSVLYGGSTQLPDNTYTRRGYDFAGWYAYRTSDDTWLTQSNSWQTEEAITANGYKKYLYTTTNKVGKQSEVEDDVILMYCQWTRNSESLSGQHRNISGVWHNVQKWRNIGGTWHQVQRWRNIGGTWRKC